ncbi:hypothetical protein GLAREA_12559 [Glarea lozoyensis ATCC 20868]|uniref:Uncharacterized protein n=1 Tax=Glarea lozoyensis (strain ATCC 20868 / MF5171) TaxID=1116229 RepID=S3DGV0_GLAL2|nr:uncharacterized protein GLAREA_12559 [Glarea lozoyensis ATCC 20868]EPE31256.1 hypothetical protein GLAREA_12559 [Glarea lozoyensis ATCC 20868]
MSSDAPQINVTVSVYKSDDSSDNPTGAYIYIACFFGTAIFGYFFGKRIWTACVQGPRRCVNRLRTKRIDEVQFAERELGIAANTPARNLFHLQTRRDDEPQRPAPVYQLRTY